MLKRQAQHLMRSEENKKKVVELTTPSFTPYINPKVGAPFLRPSLVPF